MERLCYVFTLSLSVLCSSQPASGQAGVLFEYAGNVVPNFGLVALVDIGTSGEPVRYVVCRTDNTDCCGGTDGITQGRWYLPSGALVALNNSEPLPSGQVLRQQEAAQVVQLYRVVSFMVISTATNGIANGLYRCEVPDQNGVIQTRYMGLYTEENGMPNGVGVVSISQAPQFSLISVDPLVFTLTSTTTGGPPTSTFWTLPPDGAMVSPGDTFSQRVVDAVAATVEHTLTVTGRANGTYTFATTNTRSAPLDLRNIVIEAANPPSGLMAVQSGLTSVDVSWTAPVSGGATRTGYRISYETGGSEQSVDVGAGATSHTLTGLQSGATYSITIVALSNMLPSTVLEVLMAPTVSTQELNSASITITFTQPSGSPAERYDIQYTRVTGAGQTLCGSVGDTGSATDVQSPYAIENLHEFSAYDITITARVGSAMQSTTTQVTTSPAAPSTAPRNLMSTTVLSTSITVRWNPVECIERNGVIDNYIVRFGPEGGAQSERTVQSEGIDQPGTYTASGLTPSTRYSFEVAAMNSAGRGPFTTPLTVMTGCPQCSCSTETTVAVAVVVVLVVLIITAGVVIITVLVAVLKHRRTPPRTQEPQPTEGVVLKTFSGSTKSPPAISTVPCAAYGPVAQGRDGDPHTYEYIATAPAPSSRDQPDESPYKSTT